MCVSVCEGEASGEGRGEIVNWCVKRVATEILQSWQKVHPSQKSAASINKQEHKRDKIK